MPPPPGYLIIAVEISSEALDKEDMVVLGRDKSRSLSDLYTLRAYKTALAANPAGQISGEG